MSGEYSDRRVVRGTEVLETDPRRIRLQKLAQITLDAMTELVGLLDLDGNVLELNQRALDAAGVTLAELEGRPLWTAAWWHTSPACDTRLREMIQRAATGELVRWDVTVLARAGSTETIHVDAQLTPVLDDDGAVAFLGFEARARRPVDVAAQEAHAAAELQQRAMHSLFMQTPMLIAVLKGPQHVVELANPPICKAWGRCEVDVIGRPIMDALPELREQQYPALLEQVYATGEAYVGKEFALTLDHDGRRETGYYNFVFSPFRAFDGAIEGVFIIASDVTEQVLERKEVDDLRRAAESANRSKDEFLAMLGHELRNPLAPILTALQLMRLRGDAGSDRERIVIERQVSHLTRLVDDLLDVSRIAQGRVELELERVELPDIVARSIEMTSPLIEEHAHTLIVEGPAQGLTVEGDPERLCQVMSNLLTNAAKYTAPGGTITVRGERTADDVVISVRDTGVGIDADMLPKVFDPFAQAHQGIDRSRGGLGIGLTIVRNLVERHGGSVSAHSEGPGTGSEFVVRLPAAHAAEVTEQPPVVAAPVASHARILVVDDNVDAAEMLAAALESRGFETRVAFDAPSALQVAQEQHPDVALLDLGLPVMDGYELAAHLRELPGLEHVRLVAVTGYGQASDRERTREAGFDHHLVKPVKLSAVEATLRK